MKVPLPKWTDDYLDRRYGKFGISRDEAERVLRERIDFACRIQEFLDSQREVVVKIKVVDSVEFDEGEG